MDIYNNTIHSATNFKPKDIDFNSNNITNTEEIMEKCNKIKSAIKVLMENRKNSVDIAKKNRQMPKELDTNKTFYVKVTQRITKDKEPFTISEVKVLDKYGIKIHKNRIKK